MHRIRAEWLWGPTELSPSSAVVSYTYDAGANGKGTDPLIDQEARPPSGYDVLGRTPASGTIAGITKNGATPTIGRLRRHAVTYP